jgi:acetyl-CoA carboxylase carboxyltransferase component
VKRLFAWVAGAAGGLAAYRAVKGNRVLVEVEHDSRAAELKARLEAARTAEDDRDTFESGEVTVDEALDPQSRRAQVHEQGRAALDEMRGETP